MGDEFNPCEWCSLCNTEADNCLGCDYRMRGDRIADLESRLAAKEKECQEAKQAAAMSVRFIESATAIEQERNDLARSLRSLERTSSEESGRAITEVARLQSQLRESESNAAAMHQKIAALRIALKQCVEALEEVDTEDGAEAVASAQCALASTSFESVADAGRSLIAELEGLRREREEWKRASDSWRVAEVQWQEWASRITGNKSHGDSTARDAIESRLSSAERVVESGKTVWIEYDANTSGTWASVEALRDALAEHEKAGKP